MGAARGISFSLLRELIRPALAIAMLGAIESLLSAVIADAHDRHETRPQRGARRPRHRQYRRPVLRRHRRDGSSRSHGHEHPRRRTSPIAAVDPLAVVLLAAVLVAAPLVAYVPMAALAGLLLLVAWNMSDVRHFVHTIRVAPRSDVVVLLTCFGLTVAFDMVVSIGVGVVLAALLFMKRMSELTSSRVLGGSAGEPSRSLPPGVRVYEIAGPLFFGAAQRAMGRLETVGGRGARGRPGARRGARHRRDGARGPRERARAPSPAGKLVVIAGRSPSRASVFDKANLEEDYGSVFVAATLDEALQLASDLLLLSPQGAPSSQSNVAPA